MTNSNARVEEKMTEPGAAIPSEEKTHLACDSRDIVINLTVVPLHCRDDAVKSEVDTSVLVQELSPGATSYPVQVSTAGKKQLSPALLRQTICRVMRALSSYMRTSPYSRSTVKVSRCIFPFFPTITKYSYNW